MQYYQYFTLLGKNGMMEKWNWSEAELDEVNIG